MVRRTIWSIGKKCAIYDSTVYWPNSRLMFDNLWLLYPKFFWNLYGFALLFTPLFSLYFRELFFATLHPTLSTHGGSFHQLAITLRFNILM
jgi:hypothetical protein